MQRRQSARGRRSQLSSLARLALALALRLWSLAGWTINVDHEGAFSDDGEDDLLGRVERIDVSVYQSGWDVKQAAFLHLGHVTAAWAELKARSPSQYVPQDLALAMVVPPGGRTRLGTGAHERRAARLKRDLPYHARRRRGRGQRAAGHR